MLLRNFRIATLLYASPRGLQVAILLLAGGRVSWETVTGQIAHLQVDCRRAMEKMAGNTTLQLLDFKTKQVLQQVRKEVQRYTLS
jgi:hypothetical protein